jgi:hypothetical protein
VKSSLLRICRLPEIIFQRKGTQVPINAEHSNSTGARSRNSRRCLPQRSVLE